MSRKIKDIKQLVDKTSTLLNNVNFIEKASIDKIDLERKKLVDFRKLLELTIEEINNESKIIFGELFVPYFVEELRFSKYKGVLFDESYFLVVNNKNITTEEKEELLDLYKNNKLLDLFNNNAKQL